MAAAKRKECAVSVKDWNWEDGDLCIYPDGGVDPDQDGTGYFYIRGLPRSFEVPQVLLVRPLPLLPGAKWGHWELVKDE